MMTETLYKRTKTGAIQEWRIQVNYHYIYVNFGQLNGKFQTEETSCIGKQGRTHEEQARFEAKALIKKQKDRGYKSLEDLGIEKVFNHPDAEPSNYSVTNFISNNILYNSVDEALNALLPVEDTDSQGFIRPMLAKPLEEKKVNYPSIGQYKLDGVRCMFFCIDGEIKAVSREGSSYDYATTRLKKDLKPIFDAYPEMILDGELYLHGEEQSLISGAMRKKEYIPELHDRMHYWIYDVPSQKMKYYLRVEVMDRLASLYKTDLIHFLETYYVHSKEEIELLHQEAMEFGFEGVMVKNPLGDYLPGKRTYDMMKYKKFMDEEFEIIGMILGKRGARDMVFTLKTKDGIEFESKPKGTTEEKEKYVQEIQSLIGKKATVEFFGYTRDGKPYHSCVKCIRDYE